MYQLILLNPLLGALCGGLQGRKLGFKGTQQITSTLIGLNQQLTLIISYEILIGNSYVTIPLYNLINIQNYIIEDINFSFDKLTVLMLIPVMVVSLLVHIYSIDYMKGDPHNTRFFTYQSLFTFFMIQLVTGENLLILFFGWEGKINCLKWNIYI